MLVQVFPPSQVLAPHQQVSVPVFGKKTRGGCPADGPI